MYFLDKETPMEQFRIVVSTEPYVDKSMLINKIYPLIGKENRFMCITRPRRFGKTINAVMLGAYYTKGYDTHELFKDLKIAQTVSYEEHINKHHVIYIDFSRLPDPCNSYEEYISWIKYCLQDDLKKGYGIEKVPGEPIQNLFEKTNEKFIFIMDEWDSIFYKDFMQEKDKKAYLEFLKGLFKTQPYVELAYMTGVLPIAKYSTGSELNMFDELNFMNDDEYDLFFGFHEDEVKELCNQMNSVGYEELKYWYDGYYTSEGKSLFNPRSVSLALQKGKCKNYWTETGPMNEIAEYIEHNVDEVREDIVKMVAGIPVEVELEGYAASQLQLDSRDEILSAMVVFG
ncbi:AAA family ATPase, partial [Absiella sp. AM09-45]